MRLFLFNLLTVLCLTPLIPKLAAQSAAENISASAYLLESSDSLEKVRSEPERFRLNTKDFFSLGLGHTSWWIRFELIGSGDRPQKAVLEIPAAFIIDQLILYTPDGGVISRGDHNPIDRTYGKSFGHTFPIVLKPGPQTFYMKAESVSPIGFVLNFHREETAFLLQKEFESSLLHICLGFVGALVAYTLFLYFAMRVKRYRYYAIWNLCNLYLHYYKNGFIRNYWDFTNPIFTDTGWVLSFTFDCVFGLLFAVDFLEEPLAKLPKLKKIMMMHVWILLATLPIAFFSTHISLYLNLALLTTGGTMILYVSLISLRYKKLYYYFNLISWVFVLPSATLNAFVTLGIIRSTFWSHNTMIIALLIESVLTALAVSLLSGEILKNRFVDLKVKKHTLLQLKNLVYPHQVAQIEKGASVIDTMPTGRAEACVISFDIQDSTILGHEKNHEFFEAVMKRCHKMMLAYYQVDRMEANAYLIKEMGDGFLCSIGFPFKCRGDIFENSIALSEIFVEVFRSQSDKFFKDHKVFCSIGIAFGRVNGYFPKMGLKVYDLYGDGIIMATRYESMRKMILKTDNLAKQDIVILQSAVYHSLPDSLKAQFTRFDLSKIKVRDDLDAMELFYKVSGEPLPSAQKVEIFALPSFQT